MQAKLDQRALARQPTRRPSRARFAGILDEAEQLLLERGLDGFSIPTLAERLSYTRASIYHFFPTPYALLNELSRRYFQESSAQVMEVARGWGDLPWRELMNRVLRFAADYYNARPVARILLLGGPVTDQNFRIQEQTNEELGRVFRALFQMRGIELPKQPDVAWIAVDIVDGVLRHSQYRHDRITNACRDEAVRAVVSYLEPYAKRSSRHRSPVMELPAAGGAFPARPADREGRKTPLARSDAREAEVTERRRKPSSRAASRDPRTSRQ
jgi:AcrR family transcriptional regulator